MKRDTTAQHVGYTVRGAISRTLIFSGAFFAGALLFVATYYAGVGRSEREKTRAGSENIQKVSVKNRSRTNNEAFPTPKKQNRNDSWLRVEQVDRGTYRFRLNIRLPKEVAGGRRGEISLFRGAKKIDAGWNVVPDPPGHLTWSARKGSPDRRVPPGLYRVRIRISDPGVSVPEIIKQVMVTSDDSSFRVRLLSGRAWDHEMGVRIGSWEQIRRIERRRSRALKRKGRKLFEAWAGWRNIVREAYGRHTSGEDVPSSVAGRMLKKLRSIQKWSEKVFDRSNKDYRYLWTPEPPFMGELQTFVRTIPERTNTLTVTMLRQLIGDLPSNWPERYRVAGFQSDINVFDHMNRYHHQTVTKLRRALKKWSPGDVRFRGTRGYQRFRLTRLVQIPEAVEEFAEGSRVHQLRGRLPENVELRRATMDAFVRYIRTLLAFHVDAYETTARNMNLDSVDVPLTELRDVLQAVTMKRCRAIYRTLGVRVPDAFSSADGSTQETEKSLEKYRDLRNALSPGQNGN